MPKIKSAIKKLRQSEKKREVNRKTKNRIKTLLDDFKKSPSDKGFSQLASALDKAVKTKFIHSNKSARIKSRMSKLLKPGKPKAKAPKKT